MSEMTKGERADLARLIRHRERLSKAAVAERAAELLADFEQQVGTIYSYDDDAIWKAAKEAGERAIEAAEAQIAERSRELGIPKRFAPSIYWHWSGRGENAFKERREELRRMAQTRITAMEKAARTRIETHSVEAQTALIADGLDSVAAQEFFAKLPSAESLMPQLDAVQIKGLLESKE